MNRHSMPFVAGLAVVALAAAANVGCPGGPDQSTCELERHRLAPSPLTLLSDARMDRVGDGFVLLGTDGAHVLWASLGADGVLGTEHVIDVPAHAAGPWFAVAGAAAPMDRLVIAYLPQGVPATGLADVMVFVVAFDNTMPTIPASGGQIPANAEVAMASGRGGWHAGLTWAVRGSTTVMLRLLDGDGAAVGGDLNLGTVGDFECLRFSPGRGDLTVGYVDMTGMPMPNPTFTLAEINAAGQIGVTGMGMASFRLPVGKQTPSCVEITPTDGGCGPGGSTSCYGIAWHSAGIGTNFGVFDPTGTSFPSEVVLGDVRVAGTPPSIGGLGWTGKDYALVFAHTTGAEVWPISATGERQGTLPVFPSTVGHTGTLSTQPVGPALYGTYADYSSTDPADTSDGQRFLIKVACP